MTNMLSTIGRIILGLFILAHGLLFVMAAFDPQALAGLSGYISTRVPQQMQVVSPQLMVYGIIALEVLSGIALIFGFLTAPISFVLAVFCVVTAVIIHNFWALPPAQFKDIIATVRTGSMLLLSGPGLTSRWLDGRAAGRRFRARGWE